MLGGLAELGGGDKLEDVDGANYQLIEQWKKGGNVTSVEGSVNVGWSWQVVKICDISGSGLVGCWVDLQSWEEVTSAHATNLSLQRPK